MPEQAVTKRDRMNPPGNTPDTGYESIDIVDFIYQQSRPFNLQANEPNPTAGNKSLSDRNCSEGDGFFIPSGTVLQKFDFALRATTELLTVWNGNPYGWSSGLEESLY